MNYLKLSYTFSNKNECEMIHHYSIDILETVGMVVHSKEARDIFKSKGAKIEEKQVYLNKKLIDEHLSLVPQSFYLHSPGHSLGIGKGDVCTMPTYGATNVRQNGQSRPSTRIDFINLSKLNHMNKNISMSCPYVIEPTDIPSDYREMYMIAMTLKYSNKPTFSITNNRINAQRSIDLIKNFFEIDHDYILLGNVNISSPLIMGKNIAEVIMVHGEQKQPLMISCGSGLSGFTAPPTLASNFLLSNAATIGGIVFAQMICPGLPIVYGFPLFGIDPYNAHASVGHPSTALFTMAAAEMGRFYNIPCRSGGTYTDSKLLDYQSGHESFMNLYATLFSKTDLIMHTFGMEDSLNTLNYNKYFLDEALYEKILKFLKGFEINDETLMLDEIKKNGSSGNYMNINNLKLIKDEYSAYPYRNSQSIEDLFKNTERIKNKRLDSYEPIQINKRQKRLLESCLPSKFID